MPIQRTIAETRQVFHDIEAFIVKHSDIDLLQASHGKWNSAQQVEHLIISQKMTNVAFKVPGLIVGFLYGKTDKGSRTYDEVVAEYQRHLANGAKSTKEYEPKLALPLDKQKLAATYKGHGESYLAALGSKTDKELDALQVKHPILGKLTLLELAYFTLYHNRHHLRNMQALVNTNI